MRPNKIDVLLSYSEFVDFNNNTFQTEQDITHHALGLASEAGEVAGEVVQQWRATKTINRDKVLDELSDVVYHVVALANYYQIDIIDLMIYNMEKLTKRGVK